MKDFFKKLLIILICGGLNFILTVFFETTLHLPIFMDTIMVMAVLFAFGLVPSIFTFVIHYLIVFLRLAIRHEAYWGCLYFISGFFIILVTWLFTRKKEQLNKGVNFTFIYILLASMSAAIASCISGGIINFIIANLASFHEGWTFIIDSIGENKIAPLPSMIIGRIPLTCLDRIITTFLGYGIYRLYDFISAKIQNKSKK